MPNYPIDNFFSIAIKTFPLFEERGYCLDFSRYVIHISRCGVLVNKLHIHYNKHTREYITLTDRNGAKLITHHFSDSDSDIMESFNKWFTGKEFF